MTRLARRFDGSVTPLRFGPITDEAGTSLIPTAVTVTVTLDGNALALTSTPTINALSGIVALTFDAGESAVITSALPRLDARADWTLTVGADVYDRVQYFDVWQRDVMTSVVDATLVAEVPELAARRSKVTGVASTAGTTTTLIDAARFGTDEGDAWVGCLLRMTSGANRGHVRRVTASTQVTGTLTVSPAFPGAVARGDTYELARSWDAQIRDAFAELMTRVQEWLGRYDTATMRDGEDLSAAHLHLSVAHACRAVATGSSADDLRQKATVHQERAEQALRQTFIKYGADDDPRRSVPVVKLWTMTPHGRSQGDFGWGGYGWY